MKIKFNHDEEDFKINLKFKKCVRCSNFKATTKSATSS